MMPQMGTERLEILALEPFYGGARRLMLETLARRSRHRWTVLRLPGRRIERRLEAAAQWFAEVLNRRGPANFDVLFTSEAINLAELRQLCPNVARRPTVVYFHDNQLPTPGQGGTRPIDHVNLVTAMEATEIWFNSLYHLKSFTGRTMALLRQAPHFFGPGGFERITEKCALVPPPVELEALRQLETVPGFERNRHAIFADLRQADTGLLARALQELRRRGERFELVTIGPRGELPAELAGGLPGGFRGEVAGALAGELARTAIADHDEDGATFAMSRCGLYVSTHTNCAFDPRAVMAMAAGIRAALPDCGAYREIVPEALRESTLYQPREEFLASHIQDLWALPELTGWSEELRAGAAIFDAETAVATFDWKLANVVEAYWQRAAGTPNVQDVER